MISARDMMIGGMATAPVTRASAAVLSERILLAVLFVSVLASSVAFIEPSPHDGLMGLLAVTALIAGVRFERILVLPLLLLLIFNIGGLLSLLNVPTEEMTVQYTATSIYLAVDALLYACLLAKNTMPRLTVISNAYVLTAVIAALCGIAGYFSLFPGAYDQLTLYGRAQGLFKDPNVYGPFLIWPALIVIERMVARRISLRDILVVGIIMVGLLLSFSRGAWFHFAVSGAVMLALTFVTAPSPKGRMRVFILTGLGLAILVMAVVVLLSVDSIGTMFQERAHLLNSYDVGDGGRFRLQELGLDALLLSPNGMGPFEFARIHGLQQHNVYLQAFIVYGWIGGMTYIMLMLSTLWVGFRTAMVRTPWQPYVITALATFLGEAVEGFVIDSDHWRHFFLLLGVIWGLFAATTRAQQQLAQ